MYKFATLTWPLVFLALIGCSDKPLEAKIEIRFEESPKHSIRLSVDGKDDVVIEDPYVEQIQELSSEFDERRSAFLREHESMSRVERAAYGDYRDRTAARIRELQSLRKAFIRDKLREHGATSFQIEESHLDKAVDSANQYLEKSQ